MTTDDGRGGSDAAESIADRLRYAPDLVDEGRVLEVLSLSGPDGRATVAAAVGAMSVEHAHEFADAVPVFAETMDGDHEQGPRPFLEALARIAAADPAAVRPVADRLVAHLTAFNTWENRAAAEALRHVATAYPEEIDRIEPLFDHEQRRVQARAASVLAAATETEPGLASDYLERCAELVARNPLAREDAMAVLARAGWLDPPALDRAVETLVSVVRNGETDRSTRGGSGGGSGAGSGAGTAGSSGGTETPDPGSHPASSSSGSGREDEDERDVRRLALVVLRHVAGHDPVAVQSVVPTCVELAADDDEDVGDAAARLLVTIALQEASTAANLRDFAGSASYFDRMALLTALADASTGLPGRETLLVDFFADENGFIRFAACREVAPGET